MSEEFWVYFDKDSRVIKKISGKNENIEDFLKFSVSYNEVKDIYDGKKNFNNFYVNWNTNFKLYELKPIEYKPLFTLAKFIEIDSTTKNPQLSITQNINKKIWEFKIDSKLLKKYKKEGVDSIELAFSITASNDPHILYRSIKLDLQSLVHNKIEKIHFTTTEEENDVSIYTTKYFENYLHKVKK